jgi:predicted ATPase/class 3 adenylate cyclase
MTVLPDGVVTFLFTDIEGSTRLVKALRERYADVLAEHRGLVRAAVAAHGGREVDTQGDAFFVAFGGAKQAVLCAVEIQRALAGHEWPAGAPVRVRIGIHTGPAVLAGGGYTGLAVHRAARICAAARGGQVLISQATQALVEDEEEELGFTLTDAGERRLKDLDRPVRLFKLAAPGVDPGPAPAGQIAAAGSAGGVAGFLSPPRHNLPAPLTSFLGREQDLGRVEELLAAARLVTLTGTGGTGKTRLALEAGARAVDRFRDGVWLAELAGIADPALVAAQVMAALGVRQAGDVPVLEALISRLRPAELLLVLDNCEHLLDACAELCRALLQAAPGLRVLATSREPLGFPGEVNCPVRPLDLPPEQSDARAVVHAPAVQLFMERGAAARGAAGGGVAPAAVAERICRTLDGLPLAIELAAARLGTLSAAEIETHLADRFRFLAYRPRAADPRHQALQAAMDWSYDLLSAGERRFLAELSMFAGTFALAQVAEVCAGGDQLAALEVIDRLAGKSLVVAEPAENGTRYRLLDTIRYYAADQLARSGGTDAARRRHAAAFLELAERERELTVLARDHDNFRAALQWSLSAEIEAGPRLARALGHFWLGQGLLQEGRDWLQRALARPRVDQQLRADLMRLLGAVLCDIGDVDQADAVLSEGSQLAAAAGASALQARIRILRADVEDLQGTSFAETLAECEKAAAVLESDGDLEGLAEALTSVGKVRYWLGDVTGSEEVLERAITCARQSGNHRAQMRASHWLAVTFSVMPIPVDAALARAEQLLSEAGGDLWAEADLLKPTSVLYAYIGRSADARAAIDRSQSIFASFGAQFMLAESAIPASLVGLITADPEAAERYAQAGREIFRTMGQGGGFAVDLTCLLADALYDQGRFDEAQQMLDQARAASHPDKAGITSLTQAKLLARQGQVEAARQLAGQEEALLSPSSLPIEHATVLETKAEIERLAGAPAQAAASLRAAIEIYDGLRAIALAERARTALAGLTDQP